MQVLLASLSVHQVHTVPKEARRGHGGLWSWSYSWLQATISIQEREVGYLARAARALNRGAISSNPTMPCFMEIMSNNIKKCLVEFIIWLVIFFKLTHPSFYTIFTNNTKIWFSSNVYAFSNPFTKGMRNVLEKGKWMDNLIRALALRNFNISIT